MKTILTTLFFLICQSSAFAYDPSQQSQDLATLKRIKVEEIACNPPQIKTRYEQSKCFSRFYKKLSQHIVHPAMASGFKTIAFLYDEAAQIDELGSTGKIKPDVRDSAFNQIKQKIQDEDEYAFSRLRISIDADTTRRAEVRANNLMNWSLNLLGNTLSSNARNMPSNQTYIIDGKMINCVTMGTLTNCN